MHRCLSRGRDEGGAVAIMVAFLMTSLLIIAAMVLDFGLVRIDRQIDKSAADAATLAGLHGLNMGTGEPHPYVGVCTAVKYLKANHDRFSTINENTGWTNGLGAATGNGCSDVSLRNRICKPTDKSSWAKWSWSGTSRGVKLNISVESGYDLTLAANKWAEDSLPASDDDTGDPLDAGCDHLAVTIHQSREPGLGSLATDSDLATAIRSVGRVKAVPGDSAPAMLLLKRTGCPVLVTGSNAGDSYIRVSGAVSSDGNSQPGTIHSDSDGAGCTGGNNSWVYGGLAPHGIVAYAAPLVSNPSLPDPAKPGSITSVAAANGLGGTIVRDSGDHVYGTSALSGTTGTKLPVTPRSQVTRALVDERYFPGVKGALSVANGIFSQGGTSAPSGWTPLSATSVCAPTQAEVNASVATANSATGGRLYIGCTGPSGFEGTGPTLSIGASQVYFKGMVAPGSNVALSLPNATKVYVGNHANKPNAIIVANNTSLSINNATSNLDATTGNCNVGTSASKTLLVVRNGPFKQTGGLLRMCRTTAIMMGNMTTSTSTTGPGCVPVNPGVAPTNTPCDGALGNGQFTQNGGGINWTAPDTLDATRDPVTGAPTPAAVAAWHSVDGSEDLALWSESGSNSSTNFSMAGGGLFEVRGVFMVPNADPFIISGGSQLDLRNAQYVASSVQLNGNGTRVLMSVEPNSAVVLPDQGLVGLVR